MGDAAGTILPLASEFSQEVRAMRALPGPLEAVDVRITQWMARYGVVTLRVALGVVFFWFGILNVYP